MATVYLCEDIKHKRKVALKLLKPELAAVLGAERFVQEITTRAAHAAWLRSLELDPTFVSTHEAAAIAYAVRGDPARALAEILRQPASGLSAAAKGARAFVFARSGRRSDAEAIVREIEGWRTATGVILYGLGYAYLGLGDIDRAIDALIRAARTHDAYAPFTPDYAPLRGHPRFAEFLRALNLQDQPIAKFAGRGK